MGFREDTAAISSSNRTLRFHVGRTLVDVQGKGKESDVDTYVHVHPQEFKSEFAKIITEIGAAMEAASPSDSDFEVAELGFWVSVSWKGKLAINSFDGAVATNGTGFHVRMRQRQPVAMPNETGTSEFQYR